MSNSVFWGKKKKKKKKQKNFKISSAENLLRMLSAKIHNSIKYFICTYVQLHV